MAKGDIVLISFPFTDLSGKKIRPVVILTEAVFDVTVCFITSQIGWQEPTDILLYPTASNGLKKQSLIRTSKLATFQKSLIEGRIGKITVDEISELNKKLIELLHLD